MDFEFLMLEVVGGLLLCLFPEHVLHVHLWIFGPNFHAKNFELLWELPFLERTKLSVKVLLWQLE